MDNRLDAKVKAVNRTHEFARELSVQLIEIFRSLVGKQPTKNDGSLLAKYEKLLPKFPYGNGIHVHYSRSEYRLCWRVQITEFVNEWNHMSHEVTVNIGRLQHGSLIEICEPYSEREDFTAEEIQQKRDIYKEAKRIADEALSKLYPFGEYDRQ